MNNELYHNGILGHKWGVRRFQRNDGTLTDAGKKRYNKSTSEFVKQVKSELKKKGKIVAGAAVSAGAVTAGRLWTQYFLNKG